MSSAEKYPELQDIRKAIKTPLQPGQKHQLPEDGSRIRIKRNMFEKNDASHAQQWKTLNERARTIVSRRRFRRHDVIDSTSHHCEVLGPVYCAHCIRKAQLRKFRDEVASVFPVVNIRASLIQANDSRTNRTSNVRVQTISTSARDPLTNRKPERSILVKNRRHRDERGTRYVYSDEKHVTASQLHQRVMNARKRQFILQNGDVINNFVTFPIDSEVAYERSDVSVKRAHFER